MGQKRKTDLREKGLANDWLIKPVAILAIALGLSTVVGACTEENPPKNTFEAVEWEQPLEFDYGHSVNSYLSITTHMYVSNVDMPITGRSLIIAFASTVGSADDLVLQLTGLANTYNAVVVSPQIDAYFEHGWSPYYRLIDSLLVNTAINPEAVFMAGYSSGAGSALNFSKEYGKEVVQGTLLLAAGRGVGLSEDKTSWNRLPKICQCTGTDDITYEANKNLHELFGTYGVSAKIVEVPDYSHGNMLSKEYLAQQIECFEYLKF